MALVKCKEFGSEARSKPTKCVKYGAPGVKQQTGAGKMGQERWWAAWGCL